ncbi:MAG: hypothetical protein HXS52_11455 [Theionarchaea archaeon]|nr:hypothetical protein [Theionarchaea archaeon]MBU7038537.1 hypothetical protein [Theionarchaea archaeon]
MAETVRRFHADQNAQKELEELRGQMADVEKMLKVMVKMPGFDKLIDEAADKSV